MIGGGLEAKRRKDKRGAVVIRYDMMDGEEGDDGKRRGDEGWGEGEGRAWYGAVRNGM